MSQNINFNIHEVDEEEHEVESLLQFLVYGEIYEFFTEDDDVLDIVINESMNLDSVEKGNTVVNVFPQKYQTFNTHITECSICLDKFDDNDTVSILNDCKHIFHTDCIIEAGKYKPECPLCRKSIPIIE